LLALINDWKSQHPEISEHFVIAHNNSDFEIVEKTEYSYTEIPVAKLRRYFSLENFLDFFRFIGNIFRAFFILKKQKPDIIFSKGGFVSLPIGLVAKVMKIKFYLHETDSSMGLSNRILSRFAEKVFTGFPSKNPTYVYVGNPVREEFFLENSKNSNSVETRCTVSLPEKNAFSKPPLKIFIFGGSQGASAINKWARNFFSEYFNQIFKTEVLLVTGKGKKHNPLFEEDNHGKRPNFSEVEFLHTDFSQKIHEADIVITRAGGSISELAAAQKCTVLIPLPSAANNHQLHNAQFFAEKNAAILIEEKNLYSDETQKILEELITNKKTRENFSQNLSEFASRDVAEKIWAEIS